jgi:hypothetical protein
MLWHLNHLNPISIDSVASQAENNAPEEEQNAEE